MAADYFSHLSFRKDHGIREESWKNILLYTDREPMVEVEGADNVPLANYFVKNRAIADKVKAIRIYGFNINHDTIDYVKNNKQYDLEEPTEDFDTMEKYLERRYDELIEFLKKNIDTAYSLSVEEAVEKLPDEFLYKENRLTKVVVVPEEYANHYQIAGVVPFDDNGSIALYIHLVKKA